ncbi:uncharacterized protein LOC142504345 [Primulina tabacum]|uniref:uncharacterized protein LOC142504345 n=1 Tax=Primulina tabacum TaxID=48773 RepID=UPI003F59AF83
MIASRYPGTLPSNTETNPKEQVKAIALRNGKVLEQEGKEKREPREGAADTSTYFVVLDIEKDMEMPLILERPFIATGKALLDVQEGKLRLRVEEEEITFDVFNALKHTLRTDNCFRIDALDSLVSNFVQDVVKDPLEATLTTELKEGDLDKEKEKIVTYFNANHLLRKPIRMRLEDLGDQRDLTPPKSSMEEPPMLELKPLPPHLKCYGGKIDASFERAQIGVCPESGRHHRIKSINLHAQNPDGREVFTPHGTSETTQSKDVRESERSVEKCEKTNLVLNWEKSHFMVQEEIVLGHKISKQGIEVDKAKVEVIKNLPPPTSVKGLRIFLGHAAYENLKERLVITPTLVAPYWDMPFEVMWNASDTTVGAVLGQRRNMVFHTIYYSSKTLDESQLNYATTEKELLAVVFALDKFHSYLVLSNAIVCQGTCNISNRHEKLLNNIIEYEVFDVWGIYFMGPFQTSFTKKYILVAVEYVSKWVEAESYATNDAPVVLKFLKKNIFNRFGTPRAIISDGSTHFCNKRFEKLLGKYVVTHKILTPYHLQTSGQVEVSNHEIKRILEKVVGIN